ncbi:MAG: threonine/serine exporter family protein [Eubacteriales bacterium]|nr:threonine/serine exporter family protein [Eubacteriales bacterium]MDD3350515.1 threonine/serine exporter family protein [Eubacteriales bacterium]
MTILLQFIYAFFATFGFCLIFHVPFRHIVPASLVGACGWATYHFLLFLETSPVFACFIGACVVGILSEILCRLCKEASLIFIIPGVLPLVPGAGMYYTMLSLMSDDMLETARIATETLLMAGGIAMAILLVSSISRMITLIVMMGREPHS